ncbi:phage holin family protein [Muricoccus pecuniae]|uniref:Putative membrane protein n=1 Tax=Muricoccus pecuniae TaxID=693023 RepID=A0A840YG38_9PROT|nr:phage holin family protein [Roseomonas pecuniae]MBB5695211.1 putative membrane protein [Roseomonas pecuniae]
MGFLIRTAITAVAFYIAANLVTGLWFSSLTTLIIAAIIFGVVNAVIRPILSTLSLPITVLTLGLFTLVINAVMLGLTALLMPGMRITSIGTAFLAAIIIWLVSWAANKVIGDRVAA